MTPIEFASLVAEMRDAQNRFFRGNKSPGHVMHCRVLERKVDDAVREIRNPQRSLFEGDDRPHGRGL